MASPTSFVATTKTAPARIGPAAAARASRHSCLYAGFTDVDPRYSPVPLWWWSGDTVELSRLCWQLDRLVEQGVHNVVVMNLAPTGPLYGSLADSPKLLSPQWWQLWEGLAEHARQCGAYLWFYDQIGFSGANLQGRLVSAEPLYTGASLERVVHDTQGPSELACPAAGYPIAAAALPLDESDQVVGPPTPIAVDDDTVARWTGTGRHRLLLAYGLPQGFDYTSPQACAALLDTVHGEFERRLGDYLGEVIVGSFQDELPSMPTWSRTFADEFASRKGYRLEPVIAALWEDWGIESARVRADYQRVRAALAEDAFFRPLHDWHERHGLLVGVDQQSPSRVGEPLGCTTQYADYARTHRWYSAPGSDHHGDAKIHSSLAHHYDRSRVWIEAFHSSGWGGTLEETFDWLLPWLLAGATLYDPHAVYYSTKGGWYEWAPPSTCWRQPYWRHYKHLADTVSRLCWLLTRGVHVADVALLFPSSTVQAASPLSGPLAEAEHAHRTYLDLVGHMIWYRATPGVLNRADRDFDVLDDETVAAADVQDGRLHTSTEAFRAVIVPASQVLETATAQVLVEFADNGGLLIFVSTLPEHADTAAGDAVVRRLRELVEHGTAILVHDVEQVPAALEPLGRPISVEGPCLRRRVGDRNVLLVPAPPRGSATAQPMTPPDADWRGTGYLYEHGYDFDSGRNRGRTSVRIDEPVADCEQWDPLTGAAVPAPAHQHADGSTVVEVDFTSCPAGVLVWRTPEAAVTTASTTSATEVAGAAETSSIEQSRRASGNAGGAERVAGLGSSTSADGGAADVEAAIGDVDAEDTEGDWTEVVALEGTWRTHIVPTTDNSFGDLALPAYAGPLPLQQWRLRHLRPAEDGELDEAPADPDYDDASWAEVLVGDGIWAWRSPPLDPQQLPDPLPPGFAGELAEPGWEPVRYSLSRGIENDPLHASSLGPKARVPEEFWYVDGVAAGQVVVLRTSVALPDAGQVTLAVGTNGGAEVWWNGERLDPDPGGYLRLDPVRALAGPNLLELRVYAERAGRLRGYWALTTDAPAFHRPSWLMPADGTARGTEVRARRTFRLDRPLQQAMLQLGTDGPATLRVNGHERGTQGAFEPYGTQNRVLPYDVTSDLGPGENVVEVSLTDVGGPLAVLLDAEVTLADGSTQTWTTDENWTFTRDGKPIPAAARRSHIHDARWPLLRPRPHPLPKAAWFEPLPGTDPTGGVLDVVPDAWPTTPKRPEWFRVVVPPGATTARLPLVAEEVAVFVDGTPVAYADGRVELPAPERERRILAVCARPGDGRVDGALWDGPIEYDHGQGRLAATPWAEAGLASYSGGLSYRRELDLSAEQLAGRHNRVLLDLGRVRGTAEVRVNETSVGARIWSPYLFDLTPAVRAGRNELEVVVFNTLGPYLDDASPTTMVFHGQRLSGMLGPVRLHLGSREITAEEG